MAKAKIYGTKFAAVLLVVAMVLCLVPAMSVSAFNNTPANDFIWEIVYDAGGPNEAKAVKGTALHVTESTADIPLALNVYIPAGLPVTSWYAGIKLGGLTDIAKNGNPTFGDPLGDGSWTASYFPFMANASNPAANGDNMMGNGSLGLNDTFTTDALIMTIPLKIPAGTVAGTTIDIPGVDTCNIGYYLGAGTPTYFDNTNSSYAAGNDTVVSIVVDSASPVPTNHTVAWTGTGLDTTGLPTTTPDSTAITTTLAANTGYDLPTSITVVVGGTTLTDGTDYTYTPATGALTINAPAVTGDVTVTANCTPVAGPTNHTVTYTGVGLDTTGLPTSATDSTAFNTTLAANVGYDLPATIDVTVGGTTLTAGTDYTYTQATGALTVNAAAVTGDITINAVCTTSTGATNYPVTYTCTGINTAGLPTTATPGAAFTPTLVANTGYNLPATITVTVGGSPLTAGTDYTYNQATGAISVNPAAVTGPINVTATATAVVAPPPAGDVDFIYELTYQDQKGTFVTCPAGSEVVLNVYLPAGVPLASVYGGVKTDPTQLTVGRVNTSSTPGIADYMDWSATQFNYLMQTQNPAVEASTMTDPTTFTENVLLFTTKLLVNSSVAANTSLNIYGIDSANMAYTDVDTYFDYTNSDYMNGDKNVLQILVGTPVKLTYETNGGDPMSPESYPVGTVVDLTTKIPTMSGGYAFVGWYSEATLTNPITSVTLNTPTTVYAKWASTGSSTSTSTAVLEKVDSADSATKLSGAQFSLYKKTASTETLIGTYSTNGDGKIIVTNLALGDYYWTEITAPSGYTLDSSKHEFTLGTITNTVTVSNTRAATPGMLNDTDHYAYIVGYDDNTVRPGGNITRAEVATIFFRLLKDDVRTTNLTKTNNYGDVATGAWYNTAVSTLSAMGIIKGDTNGNFRPNDTITRAEFAAIAARFENNGSTAAVSFTDIAGHWAYSEICIAANNGWVNGYSDGSFKPDNAITRAEAVSVVNRVLQRIPETAADLDSNMITWSDNADTSEWYYLAIQEASNSHEFTRKTSGFETWTGLRTNRDWVAEFEK